VDPAFTYDDIADVYASRVDAAPYNALYERPAMLDLLPPIDGLRVLDAGCAAGWYAEQLAARGAIVTGIDASAAMIRYARERFAAPPASELATRVELHVADLQQPLPFADASFDGIVSSLVLHYIRDWRPVLTELRRVLRPDGWLLFSTHHPLAEAVRLRPARYLDTELVEDQWKWVGTVRYYRRPLSEIVQAIVDAGLVIEQLVEPLPNETFQRTRPDSYQRLLAQPEFLIVGARAPQRLPIANSPTHQPTNSVGT
jgi:SAM-dependent methyltransferase